MTFSVYKLHLIAFDTVSGQELSEIENHAGTVEEMKSILKKHLDLVR